ncbi:hypothetical protein D0544_03010 [Aestuariirhabdus litorea]|uniref:Uncharacterized protein n=2 Tax=Aestuariirhabdus litorea TaxID=2528527 RepID=A0A3P3VRL1_9GAMM|nr:hypothetical protein D0544_03010 [Aestuariirhabdus litorea]RWW98646.1 hypothetical protein DZC74_03005 [Endozoicomonadaceae bacterium GTF-13]
MAYRRSPIANSCLVLLLAGCTTLKSPPLYKSMTPEDVTLANQALDSALETQPSGQGSTWLNPQNNHSGSVTPTRTFRRQDGTYCRDYLETLAINGRYQQWRDTACRAADTRWIPVR